jgi:hypothetical protein
MIARNITLTCFYAIGDSARHFKWPVMPVADEQLLAASNATDSGRRQILSGAGIVI